MPTAHSPSTPKSPLAVALSGPVLRRSLAIALIVGSILNLINQGDYVMDGQVNWLKLALTYCVPFCVSTYGAYSAVAVATTASNEDSSS